MNKLLKQIDGLAQEREDQLGEEYFKKYNDIYVAAYEFLRHKNILLYGGTAINELLPATLKIYKPHAIQDIDIFATDAISIAKGLMAHFKKAKYDERTISYSEALHENTYKVYVSGVQVADISQVSKAAYRRLSENSVTSKSYGCKIVNPQFLRMSMHFIMSKGDPDAMRRWVRTLPRVLSFYKAFPPALKGCNSKRDYDAKPDKTTAIIAQTYALLRGSMYVLFGTRELEVLLGSGRAHDFGIPAHIHMFSQDPNIVGVGESIAKDLNVSAVKVSPLHAVKVSPLHAGDAFMPAHVFLSYKGTRFMAIYHVLECVTYNEHNGLRIASIHTIIRMYMCMMLSSYKYFENYADSLECLVNALTIAYLANHTKSKKLYKDVVSKCYGDYTGINTMRKERILRIAEKK